jgi:hypothetical protein
LSAVAGFRARLARFGFAGASVASGVSVFAAVARFLLRFGLGAGSVPAPSGSAFFFRLRDDVGEPAFLFVPADDAADFVDLRRVLRGGAAASAASSDSAAAAFSASGVDSAFLRVRLRPVLFEPVEPAGFLAIICSGFP